MKLYWHKITHSSRRTAWLLTRGERINSRLIGSVYPVGADGWEYTVWGVTDAPLASGVTTSCGASKARLQREVDRLSIGLFNVDEITFERG